MGFLDELSVLTVAGLLVVGILSGALFQADLGTLAIWLMIVTLGVPAVVRWGRQAVNAAGTFALRGIRAEQLRNRVRDDSRPAFLVLRSFYKAELLAQDVPDYTGLGRFKSWLRGDFYDRLGARRSVDVLANLIAALDVYGPVVGIGGEQLDKMGAAFGRGFALLDATDVTWRQLFRTAVAGCRAVFVFPATSEGLIEELTQLSHLGAIERTIVVMPPTSVYKRPRRKPLSLEYDPEDDRLDDDVASLWRKAQTHLRRKSLILPVYVPEGMMYVPQRDLSIKSWQSLNARSDADAMRNALLPLLSDIEGTPRPAQELMLDLDDVVNAARRPSSRA